jgi:hypothetical protein
MSKGHSCLSCCHTIEDRRGPPDGLERPIPGDWTQRSIVRRIRKKAVCIASITSCRSSASRTW